MPLPPATVNPASPDPTLNAPPLSPVKDTAVISPVVAACQEGAEPAPPDVRTSPLLP